MAMNRETPGQPEDALSTFFRLVHQPEEVDDISDYYHGKLESIRLGRKTWMVRNFESEHGRIYDYFVDQRPVAFVHEEHDHGIISSTPYLNTEDGPQSLTKYEVSLAGAVEIVETQFN